MQGNPVEIKLPYFTDVYRMHWFAQPFAILCNFVLSIVYLVGIVAFFTFYMVLMICGFLLIMPFVLLSEAFNWVRGWFRH